MKRQDINIDFPEDYFTGEILAKAFNLFKRNAVEFLGREKSHYHFLVGKKNRQEVSFGLSKNLIKSDTCSCGKLNCVHLCAAVFYLRRENYSSDISIPVSDSNEKIFRTYEAKLSEKHKNSFLKLLDAAKRSEPESEKVFFLLSGLVHFLRQKDFKFSEDELRLLFFELTEMGLSQKHSGFLFYTVKESLKSQRKFESELWYYLIPFLERFQSHLNNEETKALLNQRKSRHLFPGKISLKQAALSMLNSHDKMKNAEDFVARAMILFSRKRVSASFKILDAGLETLKNSRTVTLGDYIRFVLQKARQYQRSQVFLRYAKELFLAEPFIDPVLYREISELLTNKEKQNFYTEIISDLRNKPNRQDLIFEIQFENGYWTELLKEIKMRKGKFHLLNKAALAMLPRLDQDLLNYYPLSLSNALNSAPDGNYRSFLFEQAAIFLRSIPLNDRRVLIEKTLGKLGRNHHLAGNFLNLLNPPA